MELSLHYGDDQLILQIPSENVADFIQPCHQSQKGANAALLEEAVSVESAEFSQAVNGQCVGILLPDGTRDLQIKEILSVILPRLKQARRCLFFICTGTHDGQTPANQQIIDCIHEQATTWAIVDYEMIVHDCEQSEFKDAGVTSRHTSVHYHYRLDEPGVFVVASDVKHHYFAGYSNPVKNFVPGLCGFRTTEQNHSWTMDSRSVAGIHPWHPDRNKRDNPLACDQLEAMQMIVRGRPVWALTTISSEKQIQWAAFGDAQDVGTRAFEQVDAWNGRFVKPVDYMIVSPGGMPNDVDLYIAQRALELTGSVLRDGGELLFLAACSGGIGSVRTYEQFYKPMTEPFETVRQISQADYKLFSHKPIRFIRLIERLKSLTLYSEIAPSLIRQIQMQCCAKPQDVIDSWIEQDPSAEILVVDGANKLLQIPTD